MNSEATPSVFLSLFRSVRGGGGLRKGSELS